MNFDFMKIHPNEYTQVLSLIKELKKQGHDIHIEKYDYQLNNSSSFTYFCDGETNIFNDSPNGYIKLYDWLIKTTDNNIKNKKDIINKDDSYDYTR